MSIEQTEKVRKLELRVEALERLERAHHDAIDRILDLLTPKQRETLSLPEKKSA